MVQHAFIAPTNYLFCIPEESRYHLLLAHLLTDKKYCEFYQKRKAAGDFIIVDNGAFEFKRPLNEEELYRLIGDSGINPDIVVAPDYPFEGWRKTLESTEQFAKNYHNYFGKKVKLMAVPQSIEGDHIGWLNCYNLLTQIPDVKFIGMSILGIPNAFCNLTGTKDISYNRIFATIFMQRNKMVKKAIKHHYLGLGSNVRELQIQKELGVMYGNDSSSAIWHSINGIEFDDSANGLINGKIKKEVDFNIEFNERTLPFIRKNIEFIQNLIK